LGIQVGRQRGRLASESPGHTSKDRQVKKPSTPNGCGRKEGNGKGGRISPPEILAILSRKDGRGSWGRENHGGGGKGNLKPGGDA